MLVGNISSMGARPGPGVHRLIKRIRAITYPAKIEFGQFTKTLSTKRLPLVPDEKIFQIPLEQNHSA